MKKFSILLTCLLTISSIFAQRLEQEQVGFNLGTVFENSADSVTTIVWNRHSDTIRLTEVNSFGLYEHIPYQVKFSSETIAPQDSVILTIVFQPRHNIAHDLPLVIENDGERGPIYYEIQAQGRYSDNYYTSTENLSEQALKNALNTRLANGYQQQSYNAARDRMYMFSDNQRVNGRGASVNTLEGMYSGRLATGYNSRSEAQINDQFDTEHVWPQSFFNQSLPMRSDIHHLFPTWRTANSTRGSFRFGVVTGTPSWQVGGSKLGNSIFEPRDYAKGRTARAMLYFAIRYQNYNGFLNNQESILRDWHQQFPPDIIDTRRNDDIFAFQGNKNPFVDYPQFIDRITSVSSNSTQVAATSMTLVEDSIKFGNVINGTTPTYYYMIVNDGNQALMLDNFSLSDPTGLAFATGGSDVSLEPQEVHVVGVTLANAPAGDFSANLTFNSSASPNQNTIPIIAKVEGGVNIDATRPSNVTIFPSPTQNDVNLHWQGDHLAAGIQVIDSKGALISTDHIEANQSIKAVDVRALSPGLYFLNILTNKEQWSWSFIKE